MIEQELHRFIKDNYPVENERVEWKRFTSLKHTVKGHEGEDLISYVSAISNMNGGFMVLGVEDQTATITGIQDLHSFTAQSIKFKLLEHCLDLPSESLQVIEYITSDTMKRVWVVEVPKHKPRQPVYAHNKAWQRVGDTLVEMRPERRDTILRENLAMTEDWSSGTIDHMTLDALDPSAIQLARHLYGEKNPEYADRMKEWDDLTFLNKAQITKNSRLTRTALLLLGKIESAHMLSPSVPEIFWDLKNERNEEVDYRKLSVPFIKTADTVISLIRNLKYRYMKEDSLFPTEIDKYDNWVIRECLNNCIVHQDYQLNRRINVVEFPDSLMFTNAGTFLPGSIENVIESDAPADYYRNQFLANAMVNLKMIDTQGGGIKRMFTIQKNRFFPLPEYDLNKKDTVKVIIYGKILDPNYTNILYNSNEKLDLRTVILLDHVQKKQIFLLSADQITDLRVKGFIEGRKPNIYISSKIASITGEKAKYIRNKGIDDEHYKHLILEYLKKFKNAKKYELDEMLMEKLPEFLSVKQKYAKIRNLLQAMKRAGIIYPEGKKWNLNG
jgi:ATP-dependent DNA helicase RecG